MFFNKKICTKICKKVCMNYKKKGVRCCPQSLLFGAGDGRAVKCQLDSADGQAKTGASHTVWVPNARHLLHKVQKSHQQKKDPKVFLVRLVGLEPTRSPTRPLNVRVCHSATTASMDYVSIIIFGCQEILKKNLLLVS